MNPRMFEKELLDFFTSMDGPPIPQQDHGAPEMFEQFFKERTDIQTVKIPRPKPEIKSQAFPFWRHRQSTDGGNPVLFVEVIEDRGVSFGSPSATNVWNEQEARLIDEDQMGPKSFGFFLYGATDKPPMHNLLLVPLQSPPLWFLATPSHPLKHAPHMIGVIADAKVLLDGLGNPFQGPEVCSIPCTQRT